MGTTKRVAVVHRKLGESNTAKRVQIPQNFRSMQLVPSLENVQQQTVPTQQTNPLQQSIISQGGTPNDEKNNPPGIVPQQIIVKQYIPAST